MTNTATTSVPPTTTDLSPPAGSDPARVAGWAGIGFAVAFVAGFVLVAQVPAYDAADSAWVDYVEDDNVRTVAGTMLLTAAGLLLMAFTATMATYVGSRAGGRDDHRSAVLRGAGTVAGTTLVISVLIGGAMSAAVTFAPDFEAPSGELIRSLDQLSLGLMLVGVGWSMAVAIAVCSWAGRHSRQLPGWITTAGFVVAVLLIFSPMFLPIILLPLWALVIGIVVLHADTSSNRPAE